MVNFTLEQTTNSQTWYIEIHVALSVTSVLGGGGGQPHVLAALLPGKTRYPLCRRLGGPQGRSGRVRKIKSRPPTGIRSSDLPARSESLYGLCYPNFIAKNTQLFIRITFVGNWK